MKIKCLVFFLGILSIPAFSAQKAPVRFPLETGNRWIYESLDGRSSFTIAVGTPSVLGGNVYYDVDGYGYGVASENLYVRQGEDGALYTYDQAAQKELPLTLFELPEGAQYDSRLTDCEQTARPLDTRLPWRTGAETEAAAVPIRYRNISCADSGIEEELYVENLGLARRVVSSFAGPVEYNLIYARVGRSTFRANPHSSFTIDVDRPVVDRVPGQRSKHLSITLRYTAEPQPSGTLRFRSAQLYDLFLVDHNGMEVWRWSQDQAFSLPIVELPFGGYLEFEAEVPAGRFPDGQYMLYGWLNTDSQRQPTVGIPITVSSLEKAQINRIRRR